MNRYPTPSKTASVPLDFSGVYLGIVRNSDSSGVFVELPQITAGFSFGPCNVVANNILVEKTTTVADGQTVLSNVTVSRINPPVGARVICAFLNNTFDEVVILGSIL